MQIYYFGIALFSFYFVQNYVEQQKGSCLVILYFSNIITERKLDKDRGKLKFEEIYGTEEKFPHTVEFADVHFTSVEYA